jgi:hypothetical protein
MLMRTVLYYLFSLGYYLYICQYFIYFGVNLGFFSQVKIIRYCTVYEETES